MLKNIHEQLDHLDKQKTILNIGHDAIESRALLDFYIKIMPKVLDAERCSIFILDPETRTIWLKGGTQVQERDIEVTGEYDSIVGEVISTGKYRIVSDLDTRNGIHKEMDKRTGYKTRNILCIPIKSMDGKNVTGAVQILNKKGSGEFTEEDRVLLEEMAHYLQMTIENIFYNQESAVVLDNLYSTMKTVFYAFAGVIILLFLKIALF